MSAQQSGVIRRLRAQVAALEAQVAESTARPPEEPYGPLGPVYHYQCSKCGKERVIDISPDRVKVNHMEVLEEDRHRARLAELASPEAQRLRAIAAGEIREAAEEKARQRDRDARAEALTDQREILVKFGTGPWGP